ncbi:MAG: NAD(P)H-dependent oxidoreductase subunit E [bacterium]|jgi:NADH:ubiquinone oxidoreductase subunit E
MLICFNVERKVGCLESAVTKVGGALLLRRFRTTRQTFTLIHREQEGWLMLVIKVCVGSSCHLRGAYGVINKIKDLLAKKELEGKVKLEACFCQNNCHEAVNITVGDEVVSGVTPDNVVQRLAVYLQEIE